MSMDWKEFFKGVRAALYMGIIMIGLTPLSLRIESLDLTVWEEIGFVICVLSLFINFVVLGYLSYEKDKKLKGKEE